MAMSTQHGLLERPGGVHIFWQRFGEGKTPAVFLHGGPGSGSSDFFRTFFDPTLHHAVTFDQRGCGRSTPSVVDDLATLPLNTTQTLVEDIEALREHLGIDRWIVVGLSWGATLALAYAEHHPERVTGLVLGAVTTTSRAEVEWITQDLRRVFPREWAELRGAASPGRGERIVDALYRAITSTDPDERDRAAVAWGRWEDTHSSLDPAFAPDPRWKDPRSRVERATLILHYWSHHGFLGDAGILDHIDRLAGIPALLVHGRRDLSASMSVPFDLHRAWPGSTLIEVPDEGHGGPRIVELLREGVRRMSV
ncbi:alpha/beta fold hydrolase [Microbacterium paraoxydans]|uniref:alpha/beta fold hydrolase n=1 Tax=Microbacterium paraoxydans TaxID=199592 RepID=UPI0030132D35